MVFTPTHEAGEAAVIEQFYGAYQAASRRSTEGHPDIVVRLNRRECLEYKSRVICASSEEERHYLTLFSDGGEHARDRAGSADHAEDSGVGRGLRDEGRDRRRLLADHERTRAQRRPLLGAGEDPIRAHFNGRSIQRAQDSRVADRYNTRQVLVSVSAPLAARTSNPNSPTAFVILSDLGLARSSGCLDIESGLFFRAKRGQWHQGRRSSYGEPRRTARPMGR